MEKKITYLAERKLVAGKYSIKPDFKSNQERRKDHADQNK